MRGICLRREELIDLFEAFLAIVIIGVDDRERSIYDIAGSEDGLTCAPWLGASFRENVSFRKICSLLERIIHLVFFPGTLFDVLSEDVLKVMLDYKADSAESGLIRIIKAEIHYYVALIGYLIELLIAAISAAHAGSHDD